MCGNFSNTNPSKLWRYWNQNKRRGILNITICRRYINSFENVINILTKFALWSGLKINYDKSQVVWLGRQKGSATVFLSHLKLKWNPTRFSVLGIIYSTDLETIMDLNYNPKIEQIQTLLKNWQGSLTPLRKITVIKSLTLSRITYLFFFFFFLFFCLCQTRVINLLKIWCFYSINLYGMVKETKSNEQRCVNPYRREI